MPCTYSALPARYEIKIPCAEHYLPQVRAWVRLHPLQWRVAYPPRQINNIYFDTADYCNLRESLDGLSERSELRLRWYGPAVDMVAGANLERKYQVGTVGCKDIWTLDGRLDLRRLTWAEICRALREAAAGGAALWLKRCACPVLINSYQRAYYATPDQAVRMTVDTRLQMYDQRLSARPNLRRPSLVIPLVVIELKAAPDDRTYEQLAEAAGWFPARPCRHSKYARGMLAAVE